MRSSCARVTPCKRKKSDSKLFFKNSDTMARRLGRLQPGDGSVLEGAPHGGEENWSCSCWCLSICMLWIGAHLIWLLDGKYKREGRFGLV